MPMQQRAKPLNSLRFPCPSGRPAVPSLMGGGALGRSSWLGPWMARYHDPVQRARLE